MPTPWWAAMAVSNEPGPASNSGSTTCPTYTRPSMPARVSAHRTAARAGGLPS
jgi:hypothetical protein